MNEISEFITKKWADFYPFSDIKIDDVNMKIDTLGGDTILTLACNDNDIEAVTFFLEKGADANFKGDMGYTPLHVACRQSDAKIIGVLLDKGNADPTILNEFNMTPLDILRDRKAEADEAWKLVCNHEKIKSGELET